VIHIYDINGLHNPIQGRWGGAIERTAKPRAIEQVEDTMELENKIALVTGAGATGGIGFATAKALADEGAGVVISGRNDERGQAAAEALGRGARFVRADLTDLACVRALAEVAGPVDILINNAAAFTVGPTVEQGLDGYEESFAANVRAPYFLTAALVPGMIERGAGSIVNVSTMAARIGIAGMSVYGATKAALESLTRVWAAEFAPGGVRVNSVAPGPTSSEKVMDLMGDGAQQLATGTPLSRMASVEEIAQAIVFLAGGRASYITGATIAADGGRTAV
jgi:NAD(P)-dependent dehydrogenase (short-subunit alcohol dehydrogenase family)